MDGNQVSVSKMLRKTWFPFFRVFEAKEMKL